MFAHMSERERQIVELLAEDSTISVQQISDQLAVSQVTIRSDLNSLEGKGIIIRSRGGALPAFHPDIIGHQKNNINDKKRIAQAAAALVSDGDTIMVSDGTTTSLIPRYLLGKRDIRMVTNSTLALPYLRVNPSINAIIIGGEFKAGTEAIVGSQALSQLDGYHVKYVFIGTGGFSVENGLSTHIQEGAEIVKKMASLGDTVVLAAHSDKYGSKGFVNFLPLDRLDIIVTDTGLPEDARSAIEEAGVKLIIV